MGPRVPFVSNPFGAISPNKVVETETDYKVQYTLRCYGTCMCTQCCVAVTYNYILGSAL